jgi:signal transduction histidine kinase
MAATARMMGVADLDQRLPSAGMGDELGDLSRAFNGLLDRLQESFERQRRFAAEAAHQLRSPLAALLAEVEVALRRGRRPEEYEEVLAWVRRHALRLRHVIDMLLFLARADAEAKLSLDPIDLSGWLGEHLRSWSRHGRAADLRVECVARGPLWVGAQAPLLGQLVDNLLENACKYSRSGTPIALRLWGGADAVFLAVDDAGFGIAPEDLPHIFRPFYRSARAGCQGTDGTGLGLAVASRIAAAFGGSLGVESVSGRGSRFTLRLPRPDSGDWLRTDRGVDPHPQPPDVAGVGTR